MPNSTWWISHGEKLGRSHHLGLRLSILIHFPTDGEHPLSGSDSLFALQTPKGSADILKLSLLQNIPVLCSWVTLRLASSHLPWFSPIPHLLDFKVFLSLLKMADAAILYIFHPTHLQLLEFRAKLSNCNLIIPCSGGIVLEIVEQFPKSPL